MSDFKAQMIEAFERGECGYAESYDYVRERMADRADLERKRRREDGGVEPGRVPLPEDAGEGGAR